MGLRLESRSLTLNDPERRNVSYATEFGSFGDQLRQVVEYIIPLQQKCSPKNPIFGTIRPMTIFANITENECINERHHLVKGDNLTATARQRENGAR